MAAWGALWRTCLLGFGGSSIFRAGPFASFTACSGPRKSPPWLHERRAGEGLSHWQVLTAAASGVPLPQISRVTPDLCFQRLHIPLCGRATAVCKKSRDVTLCPALLCPQNGSQRLPRDRGTAGSHDGASGECHVTIPDSSAPGAQPSGRLAPQLLRILPRSLRPLVVVTRLSGAV